LCLRTYGSLSARSRRRADNGSRRRSPNGAPPHGCHLSDRRKPRDRALSAARGSRSTAREARRILADDWEGERPPLHPGLFLPAVTARSGWPSRDDGVRTGTATSNREARATSRKGRITL